MRWPWIPSGILKEYIMADMDRLNDLHVAVRSKILEQIQSSLETTGNVAATTQYTKSDGTNYGMYQKGDTSLTDVWNVVINQRAPIVAPQERIINPQTPMG